MHLARRNRDLPTNDRKGERGCKSFWTVATVPRLRDRRVLRAPRQSEAATAHTSTSPASGVKVVMRTILLIILILLLIGAFPAWPYSSGWGYYPSGGLGIILLIVLILVLTGRI